MNVKPKSSVRRQAGARLLVIASLVFMFVLGACGGGTGGTGGGGGSGGEPGGGGVGGTGIVSMGTVSKAEPSSLTVNGSIYQVTKATKVTVDAKAAQVTDLQPGMVVEVRATKRGDNLETDAETVIYSNTLKGPIASVAVDCGSMVVLGQTVEVDNRTLPALTRGACDFSVGQIVEVSGFVSDVATNSLRATFIRAKAASQTLSLSGTVASVSTPQKTFVLGTQTIDYTTAIIEPANALPDVGQFARVEGVAAGTDRVAASEVKLTPPGLGGAAGTQAEITGFIDNLVGSIFSVNGQAIDASHAIISPSTTTLSTGLKVEVHGTFNSNNVIDASEVEVQPTSPITIQSQVESTWPGELRLLDIPILVNEATKFVRDEDDKAKLELKDIKPNDLVNINCHRDSDGKLVARKVRLMKWSTKFVVEGEVVSVNPSENTFKALEDIGVVVVIDPTQTELKSDIGRIDATTFFNQLYPGLLVRVEGIHGQGKTLNAKAGKVELLKGED